MSETPQTVELLRKRRSIRKYEKRAVEEEKQRKLIEAALLSPSSRDICPWRFFVAEEKETINLLSEAKSHGASFLANAPLAIVVAADTSESDVWIEDCSIASILIQIAAEDLGLGSCWIQIRNRKRKDGSSSEAYVRDLLGMPRDFTVESIIAVGYPAEELPPHHEDGLKKENVFYGNYHD